MNEIKKRTDFKNENRGGLGCRKVDSEETRE